MIAITRAFGGQVIERVVDRCQALRVGHGLEVVEHEHELLAEGRDARSSARRSELSIGPPGDVQPLQRGTPETVAHPIDRSCNVRPQPDRIVVTRVQRHPGKRGVAGSRTTPGPRSSSRSRPARRRASAPLLAGVERPQDARPLDHARQAAAAARASPRRAAAGPRWRVGRGQSRSRTSSLTSLSPDRVERRTGDASKSRSAGPQAAGTSRQHLAGEGSNPAEPRPPQARPAGFEPAASCSGGKRSIH